MTRRVSSRTASEGEHQWSHGSADSKPITSDVHVQGYSALMLSVLSSLIHLSVKRCFIKHFALSYRQTEDIILVMISQSVCQKIWYFKKYQIHRHNYTRLSNQIIRLSNQIIRPHFINFLIIIFIDFPWGLSN